MCNDDTYLCGVLITICLCPIIDIDIQVTRQRRNHYNFCRRFDLVLNHVSGFFVSVMPSLFSVMSIFVTVLLKTVIVLCLFFSVKMIC